MVDAGLGALRGFLIRYTLQAQSCIGQCTVGADCLFPSPRNCLDDKVINGPLPVVLRAEGD